MKKFRTYSPFIIFLTAITTCTNTQELPTLSTNQQTNKATLSEKDKIKNLFNAIHQEDEVEFQHLITQSTWLVDAYEENSGLTPLLKLCHQSDKASGFSERNIRFLLENNASINTTDRRKRWTSLTWLAARKPSPAHITLAQILINHGAYVNSSIDTGKLSPLFLAVQNTHDQTGMVQLLLKNGADTACKDTKSKTPEARARACGRFTIAEFIKNYKNIPVV